MADVRVSKGQVVRADSSDRAKQSPSPDIKPEAPGKKIASAPADTIVSEATAAESHGMDSGGPHSGPLPSDPNVVSTLSIYRRREGNTPQQDHQAHAARNPQGTLNSPITNAEGLDESEIGVSVLAAVDALLERGNPGPVLLYFDKYARYLAPADQARTLKRASENAAAKGVQLVLSYPDTFAKVFGREHVTEKLREVLTDPDGPARELALAKLDEWPKYLSSDELQSAGRAILQGLPLATVDAQVLRSLAALQKVFPDPLLQEIVPGTVERSRSRFPQQFDDEIEALGKYLSPEQHAQAGNFVLNSIPSVLPSTDLTALESRLTSLRDVAIAT